MDVRSGRPARVCIIGCRRLRSTLHRYVNKSTTLRCSSSPAFLPRPCPRLFELDAIGAR
jgi:hypothetical protein